MSSVVGSTPAVTKPKERIFFMDLLLSVLILVVVPFLLRFGWYAGKLLAFRWFDN